MLARGTVLKKVSFGSKKGDTTTIHTAKDIVLLTVVRDGFWAVIKTQQTSKCLGFLYNVLFSQVILSKSTAVILAIGRKCG